MTIKEIREMTGLSQRAFAEKYGIPKRSIENWESKSENHRECPQYVAELLEKVVAIDCKANQCVAPIVKQINPMDESSLVFRCPYCKNELEFLDARFVENMGLGDEIYHNYCSACGGKLDWKELQHLRDKIRW